MIINTKAIELFKLDSINWFINKWMNQIIVDKFAKKCGKLVNLLKTISILSIFTKNKIETKCFHNPV